MAKEMLCTNCGYKGKPKKIMPGSPAIELILWLCFIIPGLIYSAWRGHRRYKGCPKCRKEMIPLDTPIAEKMLKESAADEKENQANLCS